jgi:hypothetical protein
MQEAGAQEACNLQGLWWCSPDALVAWIAGDYRRLWGFQALEYPSA